MGISHFQQNVEVEISGKTYKLLRKVADDLWQLEETKTKRIIEHTDQQLRSFYADRQLVFPNKHFSRDQNHFSEIGVVHREISDKKFEAAKIRRIYALAVWDVPNTRLAMTPAILATWEKLKSPPSPPYWTTVFRWKKRFGNAGKDIHVLVDDDQKKGNRINRYGQEVREVIMHAIETVYLTLERKTIQDVLDKARIEIRRENKLRPSTMQYPEPTRRVVRSMISTIPAFDRYAARHGHTAAVKMFRAVLAHRTTNAPLDRAEIDHTLLDIFVIDDDTLLPLGRPWLTCCIDDNSRCVLGMNIGFEPPSYLSVAHCLKHAFLPKTNLRKEYPSILSDWISYGIMKELVVDNGQEFHSKSLENACYWLGIEIHYSARKTPWFKGKIERFLGSLNAGIAHGNPGTTFSNIFEKGDYDPTKHAVVRLSKLREIIHIWVVDYYHQKPHRILKMPPSVCWESRINAEDIPVPDQPARLDAILGRSEERKLTHKGIELDSLFYNSPELTSLRQKHGEKLDVEIRVNDQDIGDIVVFSPDKKLMFRVPAIASKYAKGLTRWQHKVCKRFAAIELKKYDSGSWLEAKALIAHLIEEELTNKKSKSRSRIARYKGGSGKSSSPESEAPSAGIDPILVSASLGINVESSQQPTQSASHGKTATKPTAKVFKPVLRTRIKSIKNIVLKKEQ